MIESIGKEILKAGLDDWVPLAAVDGFIRQMGGVPDSEAPDLAVEVIRRLATAGLIEIGQVSDGGFKRLDLPLEVVLKHLVEAWRTQDRNNWGFAFWLNNTPEGDRTAASLPT
jgi:hypothetical protein